MNEDYMATNWYHSKRGAPTGQQTGPLTWSELYSQAQAGEFGRDDLVWNPALPDWIVAAEVPGLFPGVEQPTPVTTAPGDAPLAAQAVADRPVATASAPPHKRRSWLWPVLIPVIALILVGAGAGTYFGAFYNRDGAGGSGGTGTTTVSSETTSSTEPGHIDMGAAESKAPDREKLIQTSSWGEVPANQVCVVLADDRSPDDAANLAESLGGSVVGQLEFINAYQIETAGSTEADLTSALEKAAATPGVELAFPNLETALATEIWGVRQSPLNDPAYGEGRGKGFELIGAPKAWTYVRGSGLPLSDVQVGVVDQGLWRGTAEFDGDIGIYFPDKGAGEISQPLMEQNAKGVWVENPNGSHSVMVCGVLGGDPRNGGMTGVASPVLGEHLTMSVVDIFGGDYGISEVSSPDPNDPTVVNWSDGKSYSWGPLVAVAKQIESGAKIINCSWNNPKDYQDEQTAAAYKTFFEKMSEQHPDVLFVCSAGNYSRVEDGKVSWPAGLNLPNMITVGNVMNDASNNVAATQTSMQNTTQGHEFEITLAAPGHEAVQGVDEDGRPIVAGYTKGEYTNYGGGTSAAAPQVSAAAAILLALDPELTAAEIKDILSRTARPGPPELGGKILALDLAVLEVINEERGRMGLPAVTGEDLEKGGVIDAVAISQDEPNTWMVKAIIEVLPSVEGAEITITATTGTKIEGELSQKITAPGEVVWIPVAVPNEVAEITVTRSDNGAASVITFEQIDLNGTWSGALTITGMSADPDSMPSEGEEGCSVALVAAIMEQLQGKPLPMTLDITADATTGAGQAVMVIDFSAVDLGEDAGMEEPEPQTIPFTFSGNTITFQPEAAEGSTSNMVATVRLQGESLVMEGTLTSSGSGITLTAVWTVTQE